MNCNETKENIEALLDDELDEAQKDAIEHHLWVCPDCRDLRERMSSLSSLLKVSQSDLPSAELDKRVMKSFRNHHASRHIWWGHMIFGALVIPKPAFAVGLLLALAGLWTAFQIGKISSSTISMASPSIQTVIEIPVEAPAEKTILTVIVEVPVVKEKIVTRTVFVREQKSNKNEKNKTSADSRQNNLPLYSSTVADNGYFTDVSLKGFEPSAEISAKIIKEVKEDEK